MFSVAFCGWPPSRGRSLQVGDGGAAGKGKQKNVWGNTRGWFWLPKKRKGESVQ